MNRCAGCGKAVEISRNLSRTAACPHCGSDLHSCLNCRHSSEVSHNKCREPKAEFQRSRDRANFCDFFLFREGGGPQASSGDAEKARKTFDDLFRS